MNKNVLAVLVYILLLASCNSNEFSKKLERHDTIYIHDTIKMDSMINGTYTYNLPCKIIYLNQQNEGKSLIFLWLHGGVHDRSQHDFFGFNHLQCSSADDYIVHYLQIHNIKAIVLFPICHKAGIGNCISWNDCYYDVKHIIDCYIKKGLADSRRIYVAGSSDGGAGTWDYAEKHGDYFAAALPMSCSNPRKTSIPVYFFNTSSEPDCMQQVNLLNQHGCSIHYKHCADVKHSGDDKECTDVLLDEFFSNVKP